MIFLQNDWWKPWNPLVSSSDSSLEGFGVSTAFWPISDVQSCGRRLERSRFRRPSTTAARTHALTSAGFIRDELSQQWRLKEVTDEELIEQSGSWEISKDFEEIPGRLLHRSLWEPKLWGKWNFNSGILELEGRALVKSLRRIALSVFGSDVRQLLLVDNMAVALAFDRFRSRSFALLKQIRRFSSYLLARNISTTVRWIPSEFNSSDEPSRIHAQEASKLLTHLLPVSHHGDGPEEGGGVKASLGEEEINSRSKKRFAFGAQEESKVELFKDSPEARSKEGSLDAKGEVPYSFQSDGCGPMGTSGDSGNQGKKEPFGVKFNQCNKRRKPERPSVEEKKAPYFTVPGGRADGGQGPHTLGEECHWTPVSEGLCQGVGGVHSLYGMPRGLDVRDPENLDRLLVDHMNLLYLEGHQAYKADRLAASVLHHYPQYGRYGDSKLPHLWRALKGFRRLCPGKSRLAYPLAIWAAVATRMRQLGYARMGLFVPGRGPETGPMESLEVSDAIREVSPLSSNHGESADKLADPLPSLRGKPWGNHVRIHRGARLWKRQRGRGYVMDLFAGKGGVSASCEALGFHAKQWDIIHGPEHDLTDKRVLKRLLQEIRLGRVLAVMMAPVCTSFSRARDRTKVIRNHRFPWGIPRRFLSEKEYLSIRLGNACFRSCIAIIQECEKYHIPWLLENPLSSRCWNLPPMRSIMQQPDTHFIHVDFCQFGTRWKKPTGLLCKYVTDLHRLCLTCQGKHGICSKTCRPHQLLTGTGPGSIPWTLIAQPYPKKLCSQIAHVLTSPYHGTSNF